MSKRGGRRRSRKARAHYARGGRRGVVEPSPAVVPSPAAAPPVVANVVSSLFAKLAAVNAAKRSST